MYDPKQGCPMKHKRRKLFTVVAVFLCAVSSVPLSARVADDLNLGKRLHLSDDSKLGNSWEVTKITLDAKLVTTTGYLQVKNLTSTDQEGYFYGQYFDAQGQFCFSLLFSANKNLEGKGGRFASGEVRTLFSLAFLIAPASEPTEVRLVWIPGSVPSNSTNVQTPVTLQIMTDSDGKVRLPNYEPKDTVPVADLALASVIVDSSGHLQRVEVIHAIDPELRSWFSAFLAKQFFRAATINMTPITASTLVLLRFLATKADNPEHDTEALSPTASPLVGAYLKGMGNVPLSPITSIVLTRPPTRVKLGGSNEWTILPPAPEGVFQPLMGSSEWCPDVATWLP